jgi:allantoinase
MVASDHSPAPADMKTGSDFFQVWGGISGCQSLLQLLLTEGHVRRHLVLPLVASITAEYVARRFRVSPQKGRIAPGYDADLVLVNLQESFSLQASDLLYRHAHSPYVGRKLSGRVIRTLVRGQTVFLNGRIVATKPSGRLLKAQGR